MVYIQETHKIEARTITTNETVRRGNRSKKGRLETNRANAIGQGGEMRRSVLINARRGRHSDLAECEETQRKGQGESKA